MAASVSLDEVLAFAAAADGSIADGEDVAMPERLAGRLFFFAVFRALSIIFRFDSSMADLRPPRRPLARATSRSADVRSIIKCRSTPKRSSI